MIKIYAINSSGRQLLKQKDIMDAWEFVNYKSSYYKSNPVTKLVEVRETVYTPGDFDE